MPIGSATQHCCESCSSCCNNCATLWGLSWTSYSKPLTQCLAELNTSRHGRVVLSEFHGQHWVDVFQDLTQGITKGGSNIVMSDHMLKEPHPYFGILSIFKHLISSHPLVYNSTPHPQWSSGYDFRLSLTPTSRGRPGFDSLLRSIQDNDSSSIIMSSGVG
jgi:hypothetical protein